MNNKDLYIHKFDWNDEGGSMMFNGEPKQGRIYSGEDHDRYYRMVIDNTKEYVGVNIYKSELVSDGGSWDCDIEIVSPSNLLDLDISSKDLKMMAEDEPMDRDVVTEEDINDIMIADLGDSLSRLREHDEDAYETMVKLVTIMAESLVDPNYIGLTNTLEQHPATAKVANTSLAVGYLEAHLNAESILEMNYLLNAIRQLFVETIRLHKLNKKNA
jgi:hypothetical protein